MDQDQDLRFMKAALRQAAKAGSMGEVPVGAVMVYAGRIVAQAHNLCESRHDATAHAEILAIRAAGRRLRSWRLVGCSLYATLQPCPMCAGALVQSRVERLVYGAEDPKAWARLSLSELVENPGLNHRLSVTGGILAEESAALLRNFFRARRSCTGAPGQV